MNTLLYWLQCFYFDLLTISRRWAMIDAHVLPTWKTNIPHNGNKKLFSVMLNMIKTFFAMWMARKTANSGVFFTLLPTVCETIDPCECWEDAQDHHRVYSVGSTFRLVRASNFISQELKALQDLCQDHFIHADKGNTTVVMDRGMTTTPRQRMPHCL